MKNPKKTIMLVGGGTSGHAVPLSVLYKKIITEKPETRVVAVGVGTKEEAAFLSQVPDYEKIRSGKLHRSLTLKNIPEFFKFLFGLIQSFSVLRKYRPTLIFSKGGFASFPVVIMARFLGIPYFLHESDIIMGKGNKMMAKWAKKVFVCYPKSFYPEIDQSKLVFSGPILRPGFQKPSAGDRSLFGFKNNDPVIFVTGGSQGALNLSKNILEIAAEFLPKYNIIHQAGKHSINMAKEFEKTLDSKTRAKYYLCDLLSSENGIDYMLQAINCSDLIISRAGSTIAEIAILGKPMILVPWRYSAQDHQLKNARFFEEKGGAKVLTEDKLTPELLKNTIDGLFSQNKKELNELAQKVKKILPTDGDEIIFEEIAKETI